MLPCLPHLAPQLHQCHDRNNSLPAAHTWSVMRLHLRSVSAARAGRRPVAASPRSVSSPQKERSRLVSVCGRLSSASSFSRMFLRGGCSNENQKKESVSAQRPCTSVDVCSWAPAAAAHGTCQRCCTPTSHPTHQPRLSSCSSGSAPSWRTPAAVMRWLSLTSSSSSWRQCCATMPTTASVVPSHPPARWHASWVGRLARCDMLCFPSRLHLVHWLSQMQWLPVADGNP